MRVPPVNPAAAGGRQCFPMASLWGWPWVLARHFRVALAVALLVAGGVLAGPVCAVCGKDIRASHLVAEGRTFCSRECHRQTLPKCALCGTVIEGAYLRQGGKEYCSETCFRRTLPQCALCGIRLTETYEIQGKVYCAAHARGPRCDACDLPVSGGRLLADGRQVCGDCFPSLVFDARSADKLYRRTASALRRLHGRDLVDLPALALAGQDQLPVHQGFDSQVTVHEQGRYIRDTETTTTTLFGRPIHRRQEVTRRIVILYGLSQERFISTAAHELMHDYLAEHFPRFDAEAPVWIKEGVCQFAAALVCRQFGFTARVAEIETVEGPIYGDGYRAVRDHVGKATWDALERWIESNAWAGLPRQSPRQ